MKTCKASDYWQFANADKYVNIFKTMDLPTVDRGVIVKYIKELEYGRDQLLF